MMTNVKTYIKKITNCITAMAMAFTFATAPMINTNAANVPDNQLNDMAIEVAYLVNEYREENGLNPIYVIPYLCDTARVRSRECIESFSHNRPDGSKFSTVIDTSIIPYSAAYENIAAGNITAEATMEQWKNSPTHNKAMLNPDLTHMGIGVAYEQNSDYEYYWTQLFIITDATFQNQYIPEKYNTMPETEGDVTGDGNVDTYDYLALADYIYKKAHNTPAYFNEEQLKTADCFRDGIITEADAKVLVRYVLGEYNALPYEF